MARPDGGPEAPRDPGRRVRIPHPHLPDLTLTQVRVLRLFSLLLLFTILVLYAVFRSVRFQDLLRHKTETYLSKKLARPVAIGGFDVSLLPPSFVVRDVSIANDPRGLPGPCFAASEVEVRGLPSLFGSRLELPKFRLVAPTIVFEVFEDGTNNFSRLSKGGGEGGLDVILSEAVIQRATIRFREWSAQVDAVLSKAAFVSRHLPGASATHLDFGVRNGRVRIGEYETLDFSLGVGADLSPGRLKIHDLHLRSPRISLDAFGGIDNLRHPALELFPTVETRGEELDKLFGIGVPLTGPLRIAGSLLVKEKGILEARASFQVDDGAFGPFPVKATGVLHVDTAGVLAKVTRAEMLGGTVEADVRVKRLKNPPIPVDVIVHGRSLGFETFFAAIGLPGTGMTGRGDLDTTLTWGPGGIEKADGVGMLRIAADPSAPSATPGRHALPTSGGGPLLVRNGKILFDRFPLVTEGGLEARLDGAIALGSWTPDLTLRAQTGDLSELQRVAENWYAAIQNEALTPPLGLKGSGRLEAHLTRAFGNPYVTASFEATDLVLRSARFGETRASVVVDGNSAVFAPFVAADGGSALTLTGKIGWGGALKGHYRLEDLVTGMRAWPLERILAFLDFDLPMSGPVTGTLPLSGVTPALNGRAPIVLEKGSAWGQSFDRLAGTLAFEGDRIRIADAEAALGGGSARGAGFYRWSDGGFDLTLDAESVAASAIGRLTASVPTLSGRISARVAGEGTLDKPALSISGTLREAALGQDALGEPGAPVTFSARTGGGGWSASLVAPGAASLRAETPGEAPATTLEFAVTRLGPFAALLGLPPEARLDGQLGISATLRSRTENAPWVGEGTVSTLSARIYDHSFSIVRPARFRVDGGRIVLERAEISEVQGLGGAAPVAPSSMSIAGTFGLSAPYPLDVTASANLDAALFSPFVAPAALAGRFLVDGKLGGTAGRPEPSGRAILEGVDYRPETGSAFEGITGSLSVAGDRLTARDLTMHYLGGTVDLSATAVLDGLHLTNLRATTHLASLRVQPSSGFRATISGDLRIEGDAVPRTARGEIAVERALYDANVSLDLASFLTGRRSTLSSAVLGPFDAVALDVRILVPRSTAEIRNNVARLKLWGDLLLRGNLGRPVLFGQLETEEGGRLRLRDQNYELTSGKVIFSNPSRIEPFFDVDARTSIRTSQGEYRVRVVVTGTPERLAAKFSSDPQLTEAQIVSLLASGALPTSATPGAPVGSTASSDASVTQAARDLLTGLATEALTSRTKQFFRLDRFQIDPNFQGTSYTGPRLTVGKSFGKNFTATIAYQFGSASNAQQQVIVLEYQLSPTAFIQAVQDEYGVYSVEIVFRSLLR
ncbi:MAG: translocation/assembly module TamB domain-containing protein [Thermoanaerobaculia bacterium]